MNSERLKACPFCGCDINEYPEVMVFEKIIRQILPNALYVKCPHCSASGGIGWNKQEAIDKWNKRI